MDANKHDADAREVYGRRAGAASAPSVSLSFIWSGCVSGCVSVCVWASGGGAATGCELAGLTVEGARRRD